MQEEVSQKTVALCIETGKLTGRLMCLKCAILVGPAVQPRMRGNSVAFEENLNRM